ncbi:MAG: hypothetical protein MJ152_04615, partial [Clostridia bacterium]|nr:hypothetical protein [Clostridia bacterium]
SVKVLSGHTLNLNESYFERSRTRKYGINYTFNISGWGTSKPTSEGQYTTKSFTITGNTTLYASWKQK